MLTMVFSGVRLSELEGSTDKGKGRDEGSSRQLPSAAARNKRVKARWSTPNLSAMDDSSPSMSPPSSTSSLSPVLDDGVQYTEADWEKFAVPLGVVPRLGSLYKFFYEVKCYLTTTRCNLAAKKSVISRHIATIHFKIK